MVLSVFLSFCLSPGLSGCGPLKMFILVTTQNAGVLLGGGGGWKINVQLYG